MPLVGTIAARRGLTVHDAAKHGGIGVVVIGRNEGERLNRCLTSLQDLETRVYVDSGSTDGSCELARALGFAVVELDMSVPFSAARARNIGFQWLLEQRPDLDFVQTVDGDCEVRRDWIMTAAADLAADPRRAVAFGRRRERDPKRNAYHLVCDDEWAVPTGEVGSCGGDALLRVEAVREVGGYNSALIAGEEPDMCLRMRAKGWRVWSSGAEMTWHDVAIDRMAQWWNRSRRAGFAFAELVERHGPNSDPAWRRLIRSAQLWTGIMLAIGPAIAVMVLARNPLCVALAAGPPLLLAAQMARMVHQKQRLLGFWGALQWFWLIMIAKVAQVQGWLQYKLQRITGRRATLIEYKF